MAEFALRPLSVGELLDRAFTIFRRRFGAILVILVACLIIPSLMVLNNISTFTEMAQFSKGSTPAAQVQQMYALFGKLLWVFLVFAVALLVARTALGWIAHKAMLGEDTDAMTALTQGLKLFFPMLGLLIVETVILVAVEMVLYIPLVILGIGTMAVAGRGGPTGGATAVVVIWLAALVAAILYLVASLFVTTSTLLAEADTGVFKAIERSWSLTKGRRGAIVGMLLLVYVLLWVVMFGISIAVGVGVGLSGRGPAAAGGMMAGLFGGMLLFSMLVAGFYFILQMVTYYDLRVRKEGLDLELASAAMPPA